MAALFSRPESEDLLERPDDEALTTHRSGRTQPLPRLLTPDYYRRGQASGTGIPAPPLSFRQFPDNKRRGRA